MNDTVNVPREPTLGMLEAAERVGNALAGSDASSGEMIAAVWSAMLAASPQVEQEPVLIGIILEGTQGDPAGMMKVMAELSDGRQITLIQSNGNNIYHWASTCNLPIAHPAPASMMEAIK